MDNSYRINQLVQWIADLEVELAHGEVDSRHDTEREIAGYRAELDYICDEN